MAATVLQGFITGSIARVKHLLDEAPNSTKLTPTNLITQFKQSFGRVATDINAMSDRGVGGWHYDITVVAGTEEYLLPVICDQITLVSALDSSGDIIGEIRPRDQITDYDWNYGYDLRWPYIRLFFPTSTNVATVRVSFRANGEFSMNYGTITVSGNTTASTVALPTAANMTGIFDTRTNAYVGGWFNILNTATTGTNNNVGEATRVTNYVPSTRTLTVSPSFTTLVYPDSGKPTTWDYELVPTTNPKIWEAMVLDACRHYNNLWGRRTRASASLQEYVNHMRSLRMSEATADAAKPAEFVGGRLRRRFRRR